MIRRTLVAAAAAIIAGGFAAAPAASAQPAAAATASDSISSALATIAAGYVGEGLDRQFPGDVVARAQFVDGMVKSLNAQSVDEVYLQGIAEGLRMRANVEAFRAQGLPVSNELFADALSKALRGEPTGFTRQEAEEYASRAEEAVHNRMQQQQQAFLDSQLARPGVVKTPTGLLFEVIEEGEGEMPAADDEVVVEYTGRLADGTVFDTTEGRGPATFEAGRLIPGFSEGLQMMRPGGTYRLFIPASLGYGDRGAGDAIPGGAALDFTVTLLGVTPK